MCVDHDDPPPLVQRVSLAHPCLRDLFQERPPQKRLLVKDPMGHRGGDTVDHLLASPVLFNQSGEGMERRDDPGPLRVSSTILPFPDTDIRVSSESHSQALISE